MKIWLSIIVAFSLLHSSCTNLVRTTEPIIKKPSDFDFGFVATWQSTDSMDETVMEIQKESGKESAYRLIDATEPEREFHFTAKKLSDDGKYALIQIKLREFFSETPSYYYAYALRKGEKLYVWKIDSDKLIRKIKADKINSVIDRGTWSVEIAAEPDDLRPLLIEHSGTLASEHSMVYKIQTKNAR